MPRYPITDPPDEVTEELVRAVVEDCKLHLEQRLNAVERDFRDRIQRERTYIQRRLRERLLELEKKAPPRRPSTARLDWRVPGGTLPPGEERDRALKELREKEN